MKSNTNNGCAIGARVIVRWQHWLRGGEEGVVIDFQRGERHPWLVQFADGYAGDGIDGDKLWLDEAEFAEVIHEPFSKDPPARIDEPQDVFLRSRYYPLKKIDRGEAREVT